MEKCECQNALERTSNIFDIVCLRDLDITFVKEAIIFRSLLTTFEEFFEAARKVEKIGSNLKSNYQIKSSLY